MAPRAIGAIGETGARVQDGDDERQSDRGVQLIAAIPVALTDTSGAMSRRGSGRVGRDEQRTTNEQSLSERNIISRDECQSWEPNPMDQIRPFVRTTFSRSGDPNRAILNVFFSCYIPTRIMLLLSVFSGSCKKIEAKSIVLRSRHQRLGHM